MTPRLIPIRLGNPDAPRLVAELIDVAPPKRRNPAEPDRKVSPYSVTRTGPGGIGVLGVRVPSLLHQQTDKASANIWFEPEHCNGCNAHLRRIQERSDFWPRGLGLSERLQKSGQVRSLFVAQLNSDRGLFAFNSNV